METYLDRIVAHHRARAAADARDLDALVEVARLQPAPRDFAGALRGGGVAVIAEIKRRSPSRGDLAADCVAGALAKSYAAGGAACLSVLTDGPHFGGSADDLVEARAAVDIPVLRKDFTVSLHDVADARVMGADAVLLIVAVLDDVELRAFAALAAELGMTPLVEVHDEAEAERALNAGAQVVGVNQRDLRSFAVDTERAARVCRALPDRVVRVAESGIRHADDVAALGQVGFDAVLVGEHVVTAPDPELAVRALVDAGR